MTTLASFLADITAGFSNLPHVGYGLPSERREQAFRGFPTHLRPAIPTTAEALAALNARHEADTAGQRPQAYTAEHLLVGEPPHQGHALRFTYADGQVEYFAPHKA